MTLAATPIRREWSFGDAVFLVGQGANLMDDCTELGVRTMTLPLDQGGERDAVRHFPV